MRSGELSARRRSTPQPSSYVMYLRMALAIAVSVGHRERRDLRSELHTGALAEFIPVAHRVNTTIEVLALACVAPSLPTPPPKV
jgi:hypothetical protein